MMPSRRLLRSLAISLLLLILAPQMRAQQGIAAPPAGSPLVTHVELFNTNLNGGTPIPYYGGEGGGLAYDPANGDVYFAENPFSAGFAQIVVIHSNGTTSVLPPPASGFGDLTALAFHNGNLYAADGSGYTNPGQPTPLNVIWQYAPSSGVWSQVVTSVNNPTGIAFDSSGDLYVASWSDLKVYEYPYNSQSQSFGSATTFWTAPDPTAAPYAIAFDQLQQYLYICGFGQGNGTKVFRVSLTGASTVYFDSSTAANAGFFPNSTTAPTSLAFDSNSYLYVGYYNALKIARVAPNGTSIAVFSGGGSADDAPNGLAVTPQGDVITVVNGQSTNDGRVAVIKIHGTGPSINAAADFSPTVNGGPWSYGYTTGALGSGFTLLASSPNRAANDFITGSASAYGLDYWLNPALVSSVDPYPSIVHNGGASTLTPFCCAVIPPNGLALQPDFFGSNGGADVRWTALFQGSYLVFGMWSGWDFSGPTNTGGLTIINSSAISNPYSINSFGPLTSNPITPSTTLSPNGTIDFNVTAGNNNDMTGLDAVVVQAGDTAPLSINANSVWFATQPVGTSASIPTSVTITNGSADAQTLGTLQLVGANASDFTISGDGCSNTTVSPGATCSFTTSFLPSALGARTAFVVATSTDGTTAQVVSEQFPVVGIGVPNTTLSLTASSNPIASGGSVTYTATVTSALATSPIGTVQFYDSRTSFGTPLITVPVSGSTATYTEPPPSAGLHAISAVFVPSRPFVGISGATLQETVTAPPAITSAAAATFPVGTANYFTVTATGTPFPTISLTSSSPPLPITLTFTRGTGTNYASISGTPASTDVGTYSLTITATNSAGSVSQTFTLTVPQIQTISFAPIADHFVGDPPFAVTATASSGLPVTLTASGDCTISGTMLTITGAGACTIIATQPGDSTYAPAAPVSESFTILSSRFFVHPAACPVSVTSSVFVTTHYTQGTIPFFGGEGPGIATDPAGNVYIAENPFPFQTAANGNYPGAAPAILMVSADGSTQTLLVPPGGFGEVTAVAFFQGSLYVADGIGYTPNAVYTQATALNLIWQYNPTTGWTQLITGVNNPTGIAFWNGNIYVSSWTDQKVYVFNSTGTNLGTVWTAPDATAAPYGLAFDSNGDLFIAGFGGGSNPTGSKIFEVAANDVAGYTGNSSIFFDLGAGKPEPDGLAFDAFGNLFVSYYDTGEILRIRPNGSSTVVPVAISGGGSPNGIAFDSNNNLFTVLNVGNIGGIVVKIQGVVCSPATPFINWPAPSAILSGTPLSATQLDATAVDASNNPVAGTFVYNPAAPTVLSPGLQTLSVTFTPTDTVDFVSTTASVQLAVNQAPAFTSGANTTFTVGTAGSFTAMASGYPAPTFTESVTLPNALTLSSAGLLSGTPTTSSGGVYNFTITATNGISPAATQPFTLTVNEAPSITSAASFTFTAGTLGSFSFTATGYPAPTFSVSPPLPAGAGLTLSSSGLLSGTPVAGSAGTYTLTITASNAVSSANQKFTLIITNTPASTNPVAVSPVDSTTNTSPVTLTFTSVSQAGITALTTSSAGPAVPSGFSLGSPAIYYNLSTTALYSPPITICINYTGISFTASPQLFHYSAGAWANVTTSVDPLNHIICGSVPSLSPFAIFQATTQPPAIISGSSTTFTAGNSGSFTVKVTGQPTPTLSKSGALPGGLSFNASTGLLSGTPAAGTGGTYNVTFTATNGVGTAATQNFTLTVDEAPAITSANSATFTFGTSGTFIVTATGFPKPALSEPGVLPSGLTFNSSTGVLSGTPASGTVGKYTITFMASNGVGNAASQSFTLTVGQAPTTTSVGVSPASVQYSDYTTLTATVSPVSAGGQSLAGNVQFYLNGGTVGSPVPINGSGVATLSQMQVKLSAASYSVKAVFNSTNANFAGSSATTTQNVVQEDAFILYSGDTIAQVGTSLNLRATVWDSAATGYPGANPETGSSATIGDITKIWIAFDMYSAGTCGSGTPSTLYAQVALTGTPGIGIATTALSSSSEVSYCVVSRLVAGSAGGTNQYYTAPNAQAAGLDFYVNSGQFATGGGWVNDPTGSHGNFGFNARDNSTGSPKGQVVYIYRALYNGVLADFIIKSNALTALQFSGTTYPISSTLQGKANVQVNRASDGYSLFSAGNYTFSATVTDSGQNGATGKQFSLVVYGSNGVPYHTVPSGTPLQGGNVVVHSK